MRYLWLVLAALIGALIAMGVPLVTQAPSPLGDVTKTGFTTFPAGQEGVGFNCGPWYVAGAKGGPAWYALSIDFSSAVLGEVPQVWKSTDDRKTWALIAEYSDTTYSLYNAFLPPTGTVVYMVVTTEEAGPPKFPIRILTFDFSTDSFGAPSIPHPTISTFGTGATNFQIVVQPSGTVWVILHGTFGAAVDHVYYTTLAAGAWSARTLVYTSANATGNFPDTSPLAAFMETPGRFHLWWADANAADTTNFLVYVQVSAAGVVGVPATIYTIPGTFLFNDFTTLPNISGNQVFFTFSVTDQFDVVDGNTKIACLIGTGLAAPVWQFVWVDRLGSIIPQPGTGNYKERDSAVVIDLTGKVVVFFSLVSNNGPINTILTAQIWYAYFNGATFNSPVLFFDASGTTKFPNQGAAINNGTNPMFGFSMAPAQPVDKSWSVLVSTNFNSPVNNSTFNESITFFSTAPLIPPTPGGRRPQPFIPNEYDACLARDFRRYSAIDYERLGCGRLPECFRVDEREWGEGRQQ